MTEAARPGARTDLVRPARPGDAAAVAGIYVESWRSTYAGLLPDRLLAGMRADRRRRRDWERAISRPRRAERIFVAEAAAGAGARRVVGFAGGGPARRAATGHAGEVYTLYVEDDFHGLGIGRALFSALAAGLARDLGPSLVVWVLAGNPARFFYEALGGRPAGRRLGTLGGRAIEELAYGWSGAAVPVHLRG